MTDRRTAAAKNTEACSGIEQDLAAANGRRRTRTADLSDVAEVIHRCLCRLQEGIGWANDRGEPLPNAYRYQADVTCIEAMAEGRALYALVYRGAARKRSRGRGDREVGEPHMLDVTSDAGAQKFQIVRGKVTWVDGEDDLWIADPKRPGAIRAERCGQYFVRQGQVLDIRGSILFDAGDISDAGNEVAQDWALERSAA